MRSRSHLHVGCARARLYERSRNCVHHRPSVKSGTKSGPRSGNTILARVARRCKRDVLVLLVLRELFWDLHTCQDHYQHNLRICSTTLTLLKLVFYRRSRSLVFAWSDDRRWHCCLEWPAVSGSLLTSIKNLFDYPYDVQIRSLQTEQIPFFASPSDFRRRAFLELFGLGRCSQSRLRFRAPSDSHL